MNEPATTLTNELGAELPAGIAALPEPVLDRLLEQIHAARRRQAEILESSVNTALKGVPLPVRGIVRKALT